jgi:arsenate reductase-like glutaredoxin family protein
MTKKYVITAVALIFTGTASFACYKYFQSPKLPDPGKQKTEEISKLMASDKFTQLPEGLKNKYLENLANQDKAREIFYSARNMTEEEKKNVRENMRGMFEMAMNKKAKEYFALPKEKREAFLDSELDKMAERFANRPNNPGNRNAAVAQGGQGGGAPGGAAAQGNPGGRRQGPTAKAVKQRIETTDPADRAKAAQYRKEMRARAQQRTQK